MVIGALLLPIVFVGAPEAGLPEAAATRLCESAMFSSGVCATVTHERIAKAASTRAARRTRKIIPLAQKPSGPEINFSSCIALLRAPLCIPYSLRLRISFFYREEIIGSQIVQHVHVAARPADLKRVHALVFAQPKEDARILRRTI